MISAIRTARMPEVSKLELKALRIDELGSIVAARPDPPMVKLADGGTRQLDVLRPCDPVVCQRWIEVKPPRDGVPPTPILPTTVDSPSLAAAPSAQSIQFDTEAT